MNQESFDFSKAVEMPVVTDDPVILSVSDLNSEIRKRLEGDFGLVWIKGELSNFKAHTSGHFYFSLKDDKSQIRAVMFRGFNSRLKFRPHDGLEVVIRGRVTVYEPRGEYQITCELMEPVGAGALQKAYEQLKEKLRLEGLFDPGRKKALPEAARHVAIVTSPTGAAIRDMINVLTRRCKAVQITVVPTLVQGAQAAPLICEALAKVSLLEKVDVIIIGRGGGSIEDLWAFNDERLARAIAASKIPVISAVGHEVDFTIADFVADVRAPTPSAAAELVVKNTQDVLDRVIAIQRLLVLGLKKNLGLWNLSLESLRRRLKDPKREIEFLAQRNDELFWRLQMATRNQIQKKRQRIDILKRDLGDPRDLVSSLKNQLQGLAAQLKRSAIHQQQRRVLKLEGLVSMLDSLSPLKVLGRGYSMTWDQNETVTSAAQLKPGSLIEIDLHKGWIQAEVKNVQLESRFDDRVKE